MKNKKIEQLKKIRDDYYKTKDAKQFNESINNLPPEMKDLLKLAFKKMKDEKKE
tara:strand:- start:459 stop:620 length:162 start_codon:yes stop_codon:yes gene_type:complete